MFRWISGRQTLAAWGPTNLRSLRQIPSPGSDIPSAAVHDPFTTACFHYWQFPEQWHTTIVKGLGVAWFLYEEFSQVNALIRRFEASCSHAKDTRNQKCKKSNQKFRDQRELVVLTRVPQTLRRQDLLLAWISPPTRSENFHIRESPTFFLFTCLGPPPLRSSLLHARLLSSLPPPEARQ